MHISKVCQVRQCGQFNVGMTSFLVPLHWFYCYSHSYCTHHGQGFKITRHSQYQTVLSWQAVSSSRYPAGHFMSKQQSLGIQLAQLGRDASAVVSSQLNLLRLYEINTYVIVS